MERRASSVGRPQALALPAGPRIVNTPVETFRVEAEWIRNNDIHPLAILDGEQAAVFIARRDRRVSAQSECVELIDPRIVARFRAAEIFRAFDRWSRHRVQRPALRTMLAGCCRAIERPFALATIEACEMTAGKRRPHHAIARDIESARREALYRCFRIPPGQFVDFRECGG